MAGHARRAVVYVAVATVQRSLGFALLPFVTAVMSPADYGLVSVASVTANLVGIALAYPLEPMIFRAAVAEDVQRLRLIRVYLVGAVPLGCALSGVLVFLMSARSRTAVVWSLEFASVGALAALTIYGLGVARATDRLRTYIALALAWTAIYAIAKVVLMAWVFPPVVGWAAADLTAAVVAWGMTIRLTPPSPGHGGRASWDDVRPIIVGWAQLLPQRLSLWGLMFLGRPVMALLAPARDVGTYSLAMNLMSAALVIVISYGQSTQLSYARETFPAPTSMTLAPARSQVLVAILMAGLAGGGAAVIAPVLFPDSYDAALPLLGLLLIGQVAYGLHYLPMSYLTLTAGRFRWSTIPAAAGGLMTAVLVAWAASADSVMGAALGTSVGFVTMLTVAVIVVRCERLEVGWQALLPRPLVLLPALGSLGSAIVALSMFPGGWSKALGVLALCLVPVAARDVPRLLHNRDVAGATE